MMILMIVIGDDFDNIAVDRRHVADDVIIVVVDV